MGLNPKGFIRSYNINIIDMDAFIGVFAIIRPIFVSNNTLEHDGALFAIHSALGLPREQ